MTLSGRSGTPQPMVSKEAQMTPAARHSLRRREEGGSLSLCRVPACAAIAGQFNCFDPNLHKQYQYQCFALLFETGFRIRNRIHWIHVLFGLADPHPLAVF